MVKLSQIYSPLSKKETPSIKNFVLYFYSSNLFLNLLIEINFAFLFNSYHKETPSLLCLLKTLEEILTPKGSLLFKNKFIHVLVQEKSRIFFAFIFLVFSSSY